ncbi:nucleoside diphosphate-linked moiety X motif 19 isoform X2 [Leucoraja erinacea]|uniref:nucleoside diphosphate-linked moiety X motif 19 isoform X2 n=1 Tax=Leucoraja erinaceus TaxID=7782 RepID=UPI002456297F|nr:nucleoside diphosphate-linked moiety X motif 19 isoform X2 [Leucoraja erinacea]XP_055507975.1 nucleoside diphosphate-linked moiety X motif 19 isoform X2 [Leucoraja erinacea]XP_055507976.1 nucleoside diphosphate-linked moiety X motif 19 isoform X2 [Leucoraja erinacea]XP_055507977.1 nucleoside diphosphate-linked moiety X motif 19 isoform X2 [Leucoraja erinacea]
MNRDLKYWKESATVILAAGIRNHKLSENGINTQISQQPHERNLTLSSVAKSVCDFALLLLQRNQRSTFFPNAYVFPGGRISTADFSNEWIQLFHPYCQSPNLKLDTVKQTDRRSSIFATHRGKLGSQIPGEVAFRICAIRETFEESGILLVKPNSPDKDLNKQGVIQLAHYDQNKLASWRPLVQENAANFIRLCKELDCLPNIWALKEWSNWLTPTSQGSKRFDAAFFICCLEEIPFTVPDGHEIIFHSWMRPLEVIKGHQSEQLFLPPPQWYEIGRLCRFIHLQDLQQFSQDRSVEGCERWFPIRLLASDGFATLLPGDDLYPEDPDLTGETELNLTTSKSLNQARLEVRRLHRVEFRKPHDGTLYVNIEPQYKHVHSLMMNSHHNSHL